MRNLINSSAGKYVVNVLMILVFIALVVTGLFSDEGGKPGHGGENRHAQFIQVQDKSEANITTAAGTFVRNENFGPGQGEGREGGEGNHELYGIMWLILMALHTWQHWNWYKKLLSWKHIINNKLLTATLFLFVLLVLSSIIIITEIMPRGLFNLKELHGFIGQVLIGFVLVHIIQRVKWYVTTTHRLFGRKVAAVPTIQ